MYIYIYIFIYRFVFVVQVWHTSCSARSHRALLSGDLYAKIDTRIIGNNLVAFQTQTQNRSLATQLPKSQPCPWW